MATLICSNCGAEYQPPARVVQDPYPDLCSTCWADAVVQDEEDDAKETRDERAVREKSYDSPPDAPRESER